jgi:hypothetical protein
MADLLIDGTRMYLNRNIDISSPCEKSNGGVANMVNRKLIVGILTILVILTSIQSIKPVLAESEALTNYYGIYISVDSGQGTVCWSILTVTPSTAPSSGCTQNMTIVQVLEGNTLTITGKGSNGFNFANWETFGPSNKVTVNPYTLSGMNKVTVNPYTIIVSVTSDQYILANFVAA